MWNYFHSVVENLRELVEVRNMEPLQLIAALFPNVHYIWIVRRDKVRQAVSWAKAGLTGVYAWPKGSPPVTKEEPRFDFNFIDQLVNLILEGEAGWQAFFATGGVRLFKNRLTD